MSLVGLAFAASTALGWAVYIQLTARMGLRFSGSDGLALGFFAAAAVCSCAALVEDATPSRLLVTGAVPIGLGLALLGSVIPFSLEMQALRRIPKSTFGLLMSLEPVSAAVAGYLILDERLSVSQLAGITVIVLACAGGARTSVTRLAEPVIAAEETRRKV